jgi:heme exporter protein D
MGTATGGGEIVNWQSPADFFAMGGYALYVWSSLGVCALAMALEPLLVRQRHNSIVRRLRNEAVAGPMDREET